MQIGLRYYLLFSIVALLALIPLPMSQNGIAKTSYYYATSDNVIQNKAALDPFFDLLYQLEQAQNQSGGKLMKLAIAHIGDSHLQTDALTAVVRERLQLKFGNAGRGLVFPYRVAKTNEPTSYQSSGKAEWQAKRCVFPENPMPIGVSGITLQTNNAQAAISMNIRSTSQLNYSFERVSVFTDTNDKSYEVYVEGEQLNFAPGDFIRKIDLPQLANSVTLQLKQTGATQYYSNIYGISLEKAVNGLLYHTIAVNGTQYTHLQQAAYFTDQLAELDPKLIVISLGTNEAFGKDFTIDQFTNQVNGLVKKIQLACPGTVILLTTPANSFKNKRPNLKMPAVAEVIKNYAISQNLPFWDLNLIGGTAYDWQNRKMLQADGVHFTTSGYVWQGDLFHQALISAYSQYVSNRP